MRKILTVICLVVLVSLASCGDTKVQKTEGGPKTEASTGATGDLGMPSGTGGERE